MLNKLEVGRSFSSNIIFLLKSCCLTIHYLLYVPFILIYDSICHKTFHVLKYYLLDHSYLKKDEMLTSHKYRLHGRSRVNARM